MDGISLFDTDNMASTEKFVRYKLNDMALHMSTRQFPFCSIQELEDHYNMTQIWFITGVSSGLGYEIALNAQAAGFTVIGTVRSRTKAAEQVEKIEKNGGKCLVLDVTNPDACFDVFHQAEQIHGRIDVLVNNAGVSWLGPIEDFTYVLPYCHCSE